MKSRQLPPILTQQRSTSLALLLPPGHQGKRPGMISSLGLRSERKRGHPVTWTKRAASAASLSLKAAFRGSSWRPAHTAAKAASVQACRAARSACQRKLRKSLQCVHQTMPARRARGPAEAQARDAGLYALCWSLPSPRCRRLSYSIPRGSRFCDDGRKVPRERWRSKPSVKLGCMIPSLVSKRRRGIWNLGRASRFLTR